MDQLMNIWDFSTFFAIMNDTVMKIVHKLLYGPMFLIVLIPRSAIAMVTMF